MSSSTGLSRMRSLRKPTSGSNESTQRTQKDGPSTRNSELRTTSPSRLPVKPTMTTRSAAAATSSTTATRIRTASSTTTGTTTGRSVSGGYSRTTRPDSTSNPAPRPLGRAASTRQAPSSSTATTTRSAAASASAATTTTTSTGRPRSSGGPPPVASNRGGTTASHSRSKSTVTSLTAATTLRPVSQVSSSSSGRTSPPASTITTASSKTGISKPLTRSQTHARAKSHSVSTNNNTTAAQPPTTHTSRPAFNNHQQHYSPAKSLAPKPLTSTFLAPPTPSKLPANVAISAETSRLQTELLQLSLLHRDAPAVDAEWHASARQKLGTRFSRLANDNDALLSLERSGVEARNIAALVRWGSKGLSLEEKVQILDEVLNGVWQLGEPGGRYQRVAAGFEAWASRMAEVIAAQRSGDVDALVDGDDVRFLADLDRGWKHDCAYLLRKLEGWRSSLDDLDSSDPDLDLDPDSGLARMLDGSRSLVHDMLAELAVMQRIERDAARAEDDWIERMNRAIEDEDDDTPAARAYVPLWKLAL